MSAVTGQWTSFQLETRPEEGYANPVYYFDITPRLRELIPEGVTGLMHVFIPHTTCTIIMNSGVDGTTLHDIRMYIERQVPTYGTFTHLHDGPQDASAHVRLIFGTNSLALPVTDGDLGIGMAQGIYLLELDGPRTRTVQVAVQAF